MAGQVGRAQGNLHPSLQPYGAFRCADGIVQVAVGSEGLWARFAPLVGLHAGDPRFATNADRVARVRDLAATIEAAFADRGVEELVATLTASGVPAGRVRSLDEVYEWAQTRSQNLVVDVDHATLGRISLPGPAVRLDSGGRTAHAAPPTLGQHTAAVLDWLDGTDAAGDPRPTVTGLAGRAGG